MRSGPSPDGPASPSVGAEGGAGFPGKVGTVSTWWPGRSKAVVCYGLRFVVIAGECAVAKYCVLVTFA